MPDAKEHILVRGVNWLGDAIMTTPALQRLREAKPAAHITILTPAKLADLWDKQPFVDDVIAFTPGDTLWHVARRLYQRDFTCGLILPNSVRSALELLLAGVPRRIGLARRGRGLFLTDALPPRPGSVPMRKRSAADVRHLISIDAPAAEFPKSAHHIHDYLYLTAALGASVEPLPPRIVVTNQQLLQAQQKLHLENAPGDRPWFGLNPGAEYGAAKRWPAGRFAAAAVALQKKMNCRWLVFGGPGDTELAEKITTEIRFGGTADGVLNLAGKTNLKDLAAALKMCRLLLTNDTGPMHLAAAVGTPVIVPFGSTAPELTGPIFSPNAQIVRNPPPCAPCFRRDCPVDLRCLEEIKMSQVIAAANQILGS